MKIGLIQHSHSSDKKECQNRSKKAILSLAKKGAKLVVLSELHQGKYFCQKEDFAYFDLASDYEKDLEFWACAAKQAGVVLVASLFEKRCEGLYHNTAVVFEPDGSIAGKYRKMHIPDDPSYYEKYYFTPGDLGFVPIQTSLGKLGVLVCWDQWYPEAARLMALQGANILIYPTAIGWLKSEDKNEQARQQEAWICMHKSHAIANNIPVISVNRTGFESEEGCEGLDFWGASLAIQAGGECVYQASSHEEEEILVQVDMQKCEELRRWWPFLRDRRVEYYAGLGRIFID